MTATPSWGWWVRWLRPERGAEVGIIERSPRVVAGIFIERGDAVELDHCEGSLAVKERRPPGEWPSA